MRSLENKVVLIAGAGRGIGKAVAREFAAQSANLILTSRTLSELLSVKKEISGLGNCRINEITCDISKYNQVQKMIEKALKLENKIDILVNSAGIADFKSIINTTEQEWDEMIAINLKGAFLLIKTILPSMLENGSGHIINIVSNAGKHGYSNCGAYCASKFGLAGLTDVLRKEVRHKNIHVTAVYPGAVDTNLWNSIEGEWDRTLMIPTESVARSVLDICQNSQKVMIEEIVLMPVIGNL
ncbi:MAG: hypothetical protein A2161_01500 [Candidatus Schekmanbacteria bacterium RBG_13_48_7]|uniref:Short-chain dehydrogenase n=1 Tax=Candidatus Schekmanbacteria bacterium RBG_13_48_7 TaxID=1817878 RepID=A0A1F7RWQ2_9BACT|nr:MAG: hypothetical protein A2161_01500 [Candidatus Schekmanbacteria bacterium RBG_13_48_7]